MKNEPCPTAHDNASAPAAPPEKELLTHSRMACARRCLRQHYYRYELGLSRDSEAQALRFGKAYHLGLEYWRANRAEDTDPADLAANAIDFATAGYDAVPAWADPAAWEVERTTLATLLAGYFWRYGQDTLRFLEVEAVFNLPLVNPASGRASRTWVLAGRQDGYALQDGRELVLETKTTGEDIGDGSEYWLRLRVDQQISLYFKAARQAGKNPQAVLYDVTRKPSIRPCQIPLTDDQGAKIVLDGNGERVRTKDGKKWRETGDAKEGYVLQTRPETAAEFGERLWQDILARPDFYFARREIPRLEDDLAEFDTEAWQQGQYIADCRKGGRWFRNVSPFTCAHCEFKDLCLQSVRVDPANPPAGYVVLEDKFPELSE